MRDPFLRIGLFGTFDVENYGDLLFPLLAEAELTERLGRVKFNRFSYHSKRTRDWPYEVTSVTELPRMACELDGVLIGGGFIIRFDKEIAQGYGPPAPSIHHPTGYWLTPALIALQHGIPLIWNAPGMHCNEIPAWAEELIQLALAHSRYIAVRDALSQKALARFVDKDSISVVPDTAFGIPRLFEEREPSAEFNHLREALGLSGPYIVVQAVCGLDRFLAFVKKNAQRLRDFRFLALPIGPVLDDREAVLGNELPGLVRLSAWPHPLLLAEVISKATAVVGHSYHLAITAVAFGVPVFSSADMAVGKYSALSHFESIYPLPNGTETDPEWFVSRLGRAAPSPAALAAREQVSRHWDQVAAVIDSGPTGTQSAISEFLQSLPSLLESASNRYDEAVKSSETQTAELRERIAAEVDARERRIGELSKLLNLARVEIVARDDRITSLLNSPSWKFTTPARFVMRNLKRLVGR